VLGQTFGHYRIESKLGEGGMGVVYRATDTRLGRSVAIKVVRGNAMADADRRRRFEQEARAASLLNHPNIITIHEIATASTTNGPTDFIVMEYVAGRTLDKLIAPKGLPVADAVHYAVQIADALSRAHSAGIVHRDLKPANVMITDRRLVKVLDFGLAKLADARAPCGADDASPETQTLEADQGLQTQEGVIVGTVAYMSPEQAEGRKVDSRTDVFSLGSLLYEMVTGRRAFEGETKLSILTAILHREPQRLAEAGELGKIVSRCLRKDPDRRFQHMGDVRIALEELSEAPVIEPAPRARRRRFNALAAAVLILAALAAGWWLGRASLTAPPGPRPLSLTRLTSDVGLATDPAVSRDGKVVAYASDRGAEGNLDIWVQQVETGQAIRLTRHPADDREPAFAPDGSKIAFHSQRDGGGIWVVATFGGEERPIARQGRRPRFSPDGSEVCYWVGNIGGDPSIPGTAEMYVVETSGGVPRRLAPEFTVARYPTWSADGKRLLFWGIRDQGQRERSEDWWVVPVGGGPAVPTGAYDAFRREGLQLPSEAYMFIPAEWAALGDRVLFSAKLGDSTNLWVVPLSPTGISTAGVPRKLTSGSGLELHAGAAPGDVFVFAGLQDNVDVWMLPIDTTRTRPIGPRRQLTNSAAADLKPSVDAAGNRVLYYSRKSRSAEVWVKDLKDGKEAALTSVTGTESWPIISADGSKVAYGGVEKQVQMIQVIRSSGGVPERVCTDCRSPWSFSSDGKLLLYWESDRSTTSTVAVLDLGSGRKTQILKRTGYGIYRTRFSPDDRWIAFHARNRPGRSGLFVVPFRGNPISEEEWIPATDGESYDFAVSWAPSGDVLYFLSERDGFRCIWAQRLDPLSKHPAGPPFPVEHFHTATLSMMYQTTNMLGLASARDKLVFNLEAITGNIWMAK
jgi:eukaryotic-like serine/threonine-protein kinase